jgi:hypothetical protein
MVVWLKGRVSERKLRLFAAGCCRRIWHLLNPKISRRGVEIIERFADGEATAEEVAEIQRRARRYGDQAYRRSQSLAPPSPESELAYRESEQAYAIANAAGMDKLSLAMMLIHTTQCAVREKISGYRASQDFSTWQEWYRIVEIDNAQQSTLLRDIVGNPFRSVKVNPAWLAWASGIIPKLASAIYEERRFPDLPVLADALEEAGGCDEVILSHCRGPGPHVRGCWVLDLILGKS